MRTGYGALLAAILLAWTVLLMRSYAGADVISSGVTFNEGVLTVSASDVPVGSLLDEVAQKAKIEVHVADEVKNARVTSNYSGLPLKEGLIRILEDAGLHAYLLVYQDRDQKIVSQLFVLKSERSSAGSTPSPSRRTDDRGPQSPDLPLTRMSPPIMPTVPPPVPSQEDQEFQESFPPPGQAPGLEAGEIPPPIPMPEPIPPREMNEAVPPPLP